MSAYLMRLATRSRPTGGADALQPFVRSRSPIADRDQRIGIAGLEGVGANALSSPDEVRTEPMPPKRTMPEPLPPVGITADGGSGEVTLRRKPDRAVSMTAGLSVPTAAIYSLPRDMHHSTSLRESSTGVGDRLDTPVGVTRSSVASPDRDVTPNLDPYPAATDGVRSQSPLPSEDDARSRLVSPVAVRRRTAGLSIPTAATYSLPGEVRHSTSLRKSSTGVGDRPDTAVGVTRSSGASPDRDVAPNLDPSPAATDGVRSQSPLPSEGGARSRLVSPVAVRRRSVRDTPCLEPSPRIFPDAIETSVAAAGRARANGDPREVIDQGNVDGVPPPVSTETKAPSRTGPLTAASVSVIGPLGGNLASRMAFGLRYR